MSSVTLGSFFQTGDGRTVLGGAGGSGLDTQSLITSLVEARSLPATQKQDQIDLNNTKASEFSTFENLLGSFQASLDALRNPPGVGNAADNVFKFRVGNVPAASAPYVNISASAGAKIQTYAISNISSTASSASQISGLFSVADANTDVVGISGTTFAPGVITINGQDITIEDDDTLNRIAAKFNAVSSQTGFSATVIAVTDTSFRLSFVATSTGTAANFDLSTATDPNDVLDGIGLGTAVAGTNAVFELNGIEITRQKNTVNDAIDGVTFEILQTTPDTTTNYNVSVEPDVTTVQSVINRFVTDYNALKEFEARQNELNADGTRAEGAVLGGNQVFQNIFNQVNSLINGTVDGITGSNPFSLVDIGLSFINVPGTEDTPDVNNLLTVNDGELSSALNANFEGVEALFGFKLTSNNPNLSIFSRTNALSVANFTLNVNPGTSTFEATYTQGGESVTVTLAARALGAGIAGYRLSGPSGSALEGLELLYASEATASISVTTTQGIADRLYNSTEAALKDNTGSIALELQFIKDFNEQLEDDIALINQQVDSFREETLLKFSQLESTISLVNNLLASIEANTNAQIAASS